MRTTFELDRSAMDATLRLLMPCQSKYRYLNAVLFCIFSIYGCRTDRHRPWSDHIAVWDIKDSGHPASVAKAAHVMTSNWWHQKQISRSAGSSRGSFWRTDWRVAISQGVYLKFDWKPSCLFKFSVSFFCPIHRNVLNIRIAVDREPWCLFVNDSLINCICPFCWQLPSPPTPTKKKFLISFVQISGHGPEYLQHLLK